MKKKIKGWYQVRVFLHPSEFQYPDAMYWWSLRFYGDILKKFHKTYPKVRFWFSKYRCPLSMDGENGEGLPPEFLDKEGKANSVRLRFKPTDQKQITFLERLIESNKNLWYKGVQKYGHYEDLCGSRFIQIDAYCKPSRQDRNRRGDIVQKLLEFNCKLILDCLRYDADDEKWYLESNSNPNNTSFGNISRSVTHLISNPWMTSQGGMLPYYVIDWTAINYI